MDDIAQHNGGHQPCPFCRELASGTQDGPAVALPDANPVSVGHVLVVPRRHVERVEMLNDAEWTALFVAVRVAAAEATATNGVDGVNIGINSGTAAGQTVPHAHVHVIPRRYGDCEDPRGGVRWVIAGRAAYWR